MFQDFSDPPRAAAASRERIARLRAEMDARSLAGFLVPRGDEHQSEYVPPSAERLAWLTGFKGSAGQAVVLREEAALVVDGRYVLQAQQQVDTDLFEVVQFPRTRTENWLAARLGESDKVGYDPRLHTIAEIEALEAGLRKTGASLEGVSPNLVDAIWTDRPAPPCGQVSQHPLSLAGKAAAEKIADVQEVLAEAGEEAAVLSATDSVAWLFNVRGADIAHTPVVLAHAIVHARGQPEFFVDPRKLDEATRDYLASVCTVMTPDALETRLAEIAAGGASVRLDPKRTSQWFVTKLEAAGARVSHAGDPCLRPKAIKNDAEIAGARSAHLRDGAALTRFLAWLDHEAGGGMVDEIAAARKLEEFRAETGALRDISFDTISAAGPHGAIVHYRVTEATNRALEPGSLYLVDSGGQYRDGTTDVTRTVAIGVPSEDMRMRYTRVLKAHIAVATARFPVGTRGSELDPLARHPLWQAGLDFDHGTGHGVGSYLSVHEGPVSISRRGSAEIEPGMIVSNEPGYYKPDAYGIRIENLMLVQNAEDLPGGERAMMSLEALTLAPLDRRLVVAEILSEDERAWLNAYHALVRTELSPHLNEADRAWLAQATAPVGG